MAAGGGGSDGGEGASRVTVLRRKRWGKGGGGRGRGGSQAPLTPSGQLARRAAVRWDSCVDGSSDSAVGRWRRWIEDGILEAARGTGEEEVRLSACTYVRVYPMVENSICMIAYVIY